jgi:hypothetical protein
VGALCYAVSLLLISPGPILFNQGKLIDRDVAAVQKNEGFRPQQLIDESGLMSALFTESELIAYAASEIRKYRFSSSHHYFARPEYRRELL